MREGVTRSNRMGVTHSLTHECSFESSSSPSGGWVEGVGQWAELRMWFPVPVEVGVVVGGREPLGGCDLELPPLSLVSLDPRPEREPSTAHHSEQPGQRE